MACRLFCVFVCLILAPAISGAAPSHVRLSYMEDAASSVGIAWNTSTGTAEAVMEYGTTQGSYSHSASGTVSAMDPPLGPVSEVTLTNLAPDTLYYYRVGGPQGGFSPEHSFRTGLASHPACGTFRFVVVGDSRGESWQGDQGASTLWPSVLTKASSHLPSFLLHGGDIVHDGNKIKQWSNHLKVTSSASAQLPIMYALGNHDTGPVNGADANYNRLFVLPKTSGTEDHYYFTFGNAIFIVLSTESFSEGTPPFANQAAWMDQVLSQHARRWKFVVLHRPIYTEYLLINHKPDEAGHNAALVPIINKHHVDIVFQSHNHFYERFVPSNCANGGATDPCPAGGFADGTVHITTGGAGAFAILFPGFTSKVREAASGAHHYLVAEIDHHHLKLYAYNMNGAVIDTLNISKPADTPDPCAAPLDAGPGPGKDASSSDAAMADGRDIGTPGQDTSGAGSSLSPASGENGCSCHIESSPKICALPIVFLFLLSILLLGRSKKI